MWTFSSVDRHVLGMDSRVQRCEKGFSHQPHPTLHALVAAPGINPDATFMPVPKHEMRLRCLGAIRRFGGGADAEEVLEYGEITQINDVRPIQIGAAADAEGPGHSLTLL